jgi:hypothetical protein
VNILLLNQYAPPDAAPTAWLAGDLKDWLQEAGHTVQILGGSDYSRRESGGKRWWREAQSHWALLLGGARAPRPDLVLVFTSPPMLLFTGMLVAAWHRAKVAHWSLDLYPDLAWALGECRSSEGFGVLHAVARGCLRRCRRIVSVAPPMREYLQGHYGVESEVIAPWPHRLETFSSAPPACAGPHWIYSGNLGRAHDFLTMLQAQQHLERQGIEATLVIQGDGGGRKEAEAWAERLGLRRVLWKAYAPAEEAAAVLAQAGALVVTQKAEVAGMLWPSKLALAQCVSNAVFWIGPPISGLPPSLRCFKPGDGAALAEALRLRFAGGEPGLSSGRILENIRSARKRGQRQWQELVHSLE